jgi:hypothetical protein
LNNGRASLAGGFGAFFAGVPALGVHHGLQLGCRRGGGEALSATHLLLGAGLSDKAQGLFQLRRVDMLGRLDLVKQALGPDAQTVASARTGNSAGSLHGGGR